MRIQRRRSSPSYSNCLGRPTLYFIGQNYVTAQETGMEHSKVNMMSS